MFITRIKTVESVIEAFQNILELRSFYNPKPYLAVVVNRLFLSVVWGFIIMLQVGSKLTVLCCT